MNASLFWLEDEPDQIRDLFQTFFRAGVEVHHSSRSLDAKNRLMKKKYDYMIVDLWLQSDPREGGELFRQLRHGQFGKWGRKVPVVFYTGHGKLARETEALWSLSPPPGALVLKGDGGLSEIVHGLVRPKPILYVKRERGSWNITLEICDKSPARLLRLVDDEVGHVVATSPTHQLSLHHAELELGKAVNVSVDTRGKPTSPVVELEVFRDGVRLHHFLITDDEEIKCA